MTINVVENVGPDIRSIALSVCNIKEITRKDYLKVSTIPANEIKEYPIYIFDWIH